MGFVQFAAVGSCQLAGEFGAFSSVPRQHRLFSVLVWFASLDLVVGFYSVGVVGKCQKRVREFINQPHNKWFQFVPGLRPSTRRAFGARLNQAIWTPPVVKLRSIISSSVVDSGSIFGLSWGATPDLDEMSAIQAPFVSRYLIPAASTSFCIFGLAGMSSLAFAVTR